MFKEAEAIIMASRQRSGNQGHGAHRLCVAVTAAGGGIAQTVIDCLRACPFPVRIVGFELKARAKGLFECDVAHHLPSAGDAAYSQRLISLCRQEGVRLLIPGSDYELLKISEMAAKLEQDGCRVLSSSAECIRICQDKKALHDFLVERDAPFFPTWLASDVASQPDAIQYPAILKPRWGSGSIGVRIIAAASDWESIKLRYRMDRLDDWVVQLLGRPSAWDDATWQHVLDERSLQPQDSLAVQLFFSDNSEVIGRMSWLGRMKSGVVMAIETIEEPEIWRAIEPVERAFGNLGMHGPVNIEGIWAGENTQFFEANPRFAGTTRVRALLGYREVEAAVRHFGLNEPAEAVESILSTPRQWIGLRQMSERVVPATWVQTFEETGSLSHPLPLQRVLVVGGSGFLGQELLRELLSSYPHAEVIVPVRDRTRMKTQWEGRPGWNRLRLADWEELETFSPSVMADALVHLAAVQPLAADSSSSMFVENLRLTQLAVRAAQKLSIPLFVFVSSQAVYEGEGPPWTERTPLRPESVYACAKVACEALVRRLPEHGIRYAILRMGNLYGLAERMRWERVAHRFAARAANGLALTVHGDGHQTIDLVHVKGAARAVCSVLKGPDTTWNGAYNITSGTPIEIRKLAELCCDIAGEAGKLVVPIELEQLDVSTQSSSFGSCSRLARDRLGWSPQISLKIGLEEIMHHVWNEQGSSEE